MILKAENLHKSFAYPIKTQILKGVDLSVNVGDSLDYGKVGRRQVDAFAYFRDS